MPRWLRRAFIVVGIALIALPVILFAYGTMRSWEANDWPVAEGRVVATRVDISSGTDSDGDTITDFIPIVTFDYVVDGRRYRSERLHLNDRPLYDWEPDAREELRAYPVGSALDVSYNPNNPQDAAVVIEGPSLWVFLIGGFGLAFLAAGWFIPEDKPLRPMKIRFDRSRR